MGVLKGVLAQNRVSDMFRQVVQVFGRVSESHDQQKSISVNSDSESSICLTKI